MPSPSTSRPPSRSRHGIANTSPDAVPARQLVERHRAGDDARRRRRRSSLASDSSRSSATARRRRAAVRRRRTVRRISGSARDQHVLALARHQPRDADDDRADPSSRAPRAATRSADSGAEQLGVDAGRQPLQPVGVRRRAPSQAGRGCTRRGRSGRRRSPRCAAAAAGQPGTAAQPISWPWVGRDDPLRTGLAQRRRQQSQRRGRAEPHVGAAVLAEQLDGVRAYARRRQQHRGVVPDDRDTAACASHSSQPRHREVKTTTSSAVEPRDDAVARRTGCRRDAAGSRW